jgi:hypothetical protein
MFARGGTPDTISINRAPVLTLWAAVVAEHFGFDRDEALTLGRAVAGLNARSKGLALGIFHPGSRAEVKRHRAQAKHGDRSHVELLHRAVPVVHTPEGVRALAGERPSTPETVQRYLEAKFGDGLEPARKAMEALASSLSSAELAERAFALYEAFRPAIPKGVRGWGKAGVLDLGVIRSLAK